MWFCIFCPLMSPFSQDCQCLIEDKNRCDSEYRKFMLYVCSFLHFYSSWKGTERVVFEGLVTRRWRLSQSWLTSDSVVGHEWLSRGRRLTRSSTHCFSVVYKACLFRAAVGVVFEYLFVFLCSSVPSAAWLVRVIGSAASLVEELSTFNFGFAEDAHARQCSNTFGISLA